MSSDEAEGMEVDRDAADGDYAGGSGSDGEEGGGRGGRRKRSPTKKRSPSKLGKKATSKAGSGGAGSFFGRPASAAAAAASTASTSAAASSAAAGGGGRRTGGVGFSDEMSGTNTEPWVEKYRPSAMEEMVSHKDIVNTVSRLLEANSLPHLLFYGPPGTGKTTLVLAIARKLYGERYHQMTLELNASDDRGIEVVRDQIKDFASTQQIFSSGMKMVILDEADAMTSAAQAALRRVIEKFTKTTRFCLICNYANRIIPALQSRCTRFRFAVISQIDIVKRAQFVAGQEGLTLTDSGEKALARLSQGDLRRAINLLQAAAMAASARKATTTTASISDAATEAPPAAAAAAGSGSSSLRGIVVDEAAVYATSGAPTPADIHRMAGWLLNCDFADAYRQVNNLKTEKGLALVDILRELLPLVVSQLPQHPAAVMELLSQMSDLEYRLAVGTSERIQLGGLVGAFQIARDRIGEA